MSPFGVSLKPLCLFSGYLDISYGYADVCVSMLEYADVGSFFVFKGKYKAVLIQYPSRAEKNTILSELK
jgi:hypothetical protein